MALDIDYLLQLRSKVEFFGVSVEIWTRLKEQNINRSAKERRNDERKAKRSRRNSRYKKRKRQRKERIPMTTKKYTSLSSNAKPFIPKTTDKLPSILTTNTRSVCNKIDDLNQLLEDTKVDIAFITETWLNNKNSTIIKNSIDKNYNKLSTIRKTGSKGGGTMILIRKEYSVKCIPIEKEDASNTELTISNQDASLPKIEVKIARAFPTKLPRG